MKNNKFLSRLVAVLLVLIACICISILPIFNIDEVVVKGCVNTDEKEIKDKATKDLKNKSIFMYSSILKEREIEKNAYIKKANIKKKIPNKLEVDVEERVPVAYVKIDSSNYAVIDNESYVLDKIIRPLDSKMPVYLNVKVKENVVGSEMKVKSVSLLEVNELSTTLSKYEVAYDNMEVDLKDKKNVKVKIKNTNVNFGELTDVDKKVRTLQTIINDNPDRIEFNSELDISDPTRDAVFTFTN